MHELSVCQALIRQVETLAREREAARVVAIVVAVGPLSGIEPQLLKQAYPLARAGTLAHDAELLIEELPVRVRCQCCGSSSDVQPNRLVCGSCGDWHTVLESGDELLLNSVELEKLTA
jgi:hydrogenase nickel incorporation protein HypA/HybF